MKINKLLLLLAALPVFCGCASFNSGDILVEKSTARAMLDDKALVPFSEIQVSWENFPYRSPTDSIGEGSTSPKKLKPVPVEPDDSAEFRSTAREIFSKAGLYDKERGRGTLRLELTSFGRWTYGNLFRSYLVDTAFIFIIPSSLRVNYYLAADFAVSSGTVRVETEARHKTTFHLLMAPLYPFFSPGVRENSLLKQMVWRSATDVYAKLKAAGSAPLALPPKAAQQEPGTPTDLAPPLQPDRTWLPPGETVEGAPAGEAAPIIPDKPDRTWVVPSAQPQLPAAQNGTAVSAPQAEPASQAPAAPAAPKPAAPVQPPAPEETPDD
jgi:hypothetical protein